MPADPSEPAAPGTQVDWAPRSWFEAQAQAKGADGATDYFGHSANGYQRFRHAQLVDAIAQVAPSLGRDALLDIGCATGVLTAQLAKRFGFRRAVGVDFIASLLEEGRNLYPNIEFREAQLPALAFEDAVFDLVVASEVFYYLTPEAQRSALSEVIRVLRPGGYLLFTSALGSAYYSVESAKAFVSAPLQLQGARSLHMAGYHALTQPFYLAGRLETMLAAGAQPASAEMRQRLDRWRWLLANPVARLAIGLVAWMGRPVLASEALPSWLNSLRLGRATNVILIGRRPGG